MKKGLLLLGVCVCLTTSLWAFQPIQFGVKAGATISTQSSISPTINGSRIIQDAKGGFHLGLQSRINLLAFHIQPEIIYNSSRYDFSFRNDLKDSRITVNSIDVPVMVGVKFFVLRVNAGPVFNLMTSTNVAKNGGLDDAKFNRPSVGYGIGVGADLMKITFDVRYQGQFKRTEELVVPDQQQSLSLKSRNNALLISIGTMF